MDPPRGRWALLQLALAVLSVALFCAAIIVTFASDFIDPAPGALLLVAALIVATFAVRMSPTRRWADGFKLGISWLLFGFLAFTFAPRPASDRYMARTACLSNIKQQALGMLMYAADFDDCLPLADSWHAGCQPYVPWDEPCPVATSPWSYAMNRRLSGALAELVKQPDRQVLCFEADAALPNASGGRVSLVFRHPFGESKGATIGFADGHAKLCNATQAVALQW